MKMVYCLRDAAFELKNMTIYPFRRKAYKQKKYSLFSFEIQKRYMFPLIFVFQFLFFRVNLMIWRYEFTTIVNSIKIINESWYPMIPGCFVRSTWNNLLNGILYKKVEEKISIKWCWVNTPKYTNILLTNQTVACK